jgi:hypothetical protein
VNQFTLFDCTDYQDFPITLDTDKRSSHKRGIVSEAKSLPAIDLFSYSRLALNYFLGGGNQETWINTHGGYFDGQYSQWLMYKLLFCGFKAILSHPEGDKASADGWETLDSLCREKFLQVIISPHLYQQYKGISHAIDRNN